MIRPQWKWTIATFVFVGLFVMSASWLFLRSPHCPAIPGCETHLEKITECVSWDESFQDAYYYMAATGRPKQELCRKFLKRFREKRRSSSSKSSCRVEDPSDWKPVRCPRSVGRAPLRCFDCEMQIDDDETANYLVGFSADCQHAVEYRATGDWEEYAKRTDELRVKGCL